MARRVSEAMTRGVRTLAAQDAVADAAKAMADLDVGALPICDGQRLVGMLTDRDIVLRVVAAGLSPDSTQVSDVMTPGVNYCFDDQDLQEVMDQMGEGQIRRLPVVNRSNELVGMLSLGDVATSSSDIASAGEALEQISEPARQDIS